MQTHYDGFPREDSQRILAITRRFAVPRDRVWAAWTDPAQARRWMGPRGFTATYLEGDLRPGGAWRACLRRDGTGEELWQGGTHLEISAPGRLVFTFAWEDADGRRGHETQVTLVFTEHQGRTTLSFRQAVFESVAARHGHLGGWNSAFDRLAEYLADTPAPRAWP